MIITGDKGFIGRHLARKITKPFIGFDIVDGFDVRNKFLVDKTFRENNFKTVIHMAARAGVRSGEKYPEEYISTNVLGTKNMIDAAIENNVENFIFFSSSSVYGTVQPPNREDQPMNPDSTYGITKMTGEQLLKSVAHKFKSAIIIRPFTVYGENGRGDQVVFKWIHQIQAGKPITVFGSGTNRGYTYAGDFVDGLLKIVEQVESGELQGFEIFNLGGKQVTKLSDLIDVFTEEIKDLDIKQLPLPEEDIRENYADITKAQDVLGFNPTTDFKTKIKEIINNEFKK